MPILWIYVAQAFVFAVGADKPAPGGVISLVGTELTATFCMLSREIMKSQWFGMEFQSDKSI